MHGVAYSELQKKSPGGCFCTIFYHDLMFVVPAQPCGLSCQKSMPTNPDIQVQMRFSSKLGVITIT